MTCHKIDFDLTDLPIEKRMRPMVTVNAAVTSPSTIESFGWGDFPVMTSSDDFPLPIIEKSNSAVEEPSDVTASTAGLEYEDDSLLDSELAEEEEADDLLSATDASAAAAKPLRQVTFGQVETREHVVVLGVHPIASGAGGYPMELGWDYNVHATVPIDQREEERTRVGLRRLTYIERHFRLAEMCGGNLCQIHSEEKRRKEALQREQRQTTPPRDSDDDDSDDHISEFTKARLVRNASKMCLSRVV